MGKRKGLKVKGAGQNIKVSHKWTASVTVMAFVFTVVISALTAGAEGLGLAAAAGMLLLIVLLGIGFDIIGVAVSTASEEPFHARRRKKSPVRGKAFQLSAARSRFRVCVTTSLAILPVLSAAR